MNEQQGNKLKKVKEGFDKITSNNATNWKLVVFWIMAFELIATIVEYIYIDKSHVYSIAVPHTLTTQIFVAISVTLFVWFCIYNIIFESQKNIMRLAVLSMIGIYFIVTNDFTLQFLIQNLNPLHFFDMEFGLVFFVELFFKLIITYLLYQFIVSLKNKELISNNKKN